MKQKMQIGHILMVSALLSLVSSELQCYTDFLDVVTCVWNTSSVEDRFHITPTNSCILHSEYKVEPDPEKPESILKPFGDSQTELRKGTLQFSKNCLMTGPLTLRLFVSCEGMIVETMKKFFPPANVKLYAPEKPVVNGLNVTWQRGSPHSIRVSAVKYEVQWCLLNENWETHLVATTTEEYCELPEDKLIRGKEYVIRVRSIPDWKPRYWSEWSVVTQWTSTVGEEPPPGPPIPEIFKNATSLAILATVTIVLLVCFCLPRYRRIRKCLYVPTPGKYFGDLFSDHGGDFKSWLGPIVNPEMYIIADSECISPVTIYKACNSDLLSHKMEKDSNIKDSSTSSFSNSTYFLSQSSKCAMVEDQLEPCSADCPYGPSGGGSVEEKILPAIDDNSHDFELGEVSMSSPLETSSSYKQLQKLRLDIQSPDSGFAGSSEEQESQEESGSEGLPSPPVVDNTLPLNCILPCPMPQLIGLPHLGIPPGLPWSPWNNQAFTTLPHDISRSVFLETSAIMACSGILEPSSDDYMPVKKV